MVFEDFFCRARAAEAAEVGPALDLAVDDGPLIFFRRPMAQDLMTWDDQGLVG